MRRCLRLLSCLSLLLAGSCARPPRPTRWAYADLRLLDPADAPTPASDILAVYTRTTRRSVEIRIDLLDLPPGEAVALRLSLYDNRSFSQRPLVVSLPRRGFLGALRRGAREVAVRPRLVRNYALDTLVVRLDRGLIGDRFRVDVSTYASVAALPAFSRRLADGGRIGDIPADEARDVRSDSLPSAGRAPLLLAFWEAFPAVTPAQALRRWDGAHTGPGGGRHGLKYLLEAAGRYRLPLALLDLKSPASLAALDYLGVTPRLQDLAAEDLLILPDLAYAEPVEVALHFSRRAAAGFGLPASPFVYAVGPAGAPPVLLAGSHPQFAALPDPSHLSRSGVRRLIPLPAAQAVEATEDGPALDVRRALLQVAISPDPADLVVLGGSLPHSTWGIPEMAAPTFAWLAGHPWIQALDGYGLQAFPLGPAQRIPVGSPGPGSVWLEPLDEAPHNAVTDLAWQAYLTLSAPTSDPQLQNLRRGYLGQVGALLAAADWAEIPSGRADCSRDLDGDGRPECLLSDSSFFAVIETAGAKLTHLFYLDEAGPHQLVGPSSQFALGLSDPSEWHPERGEAGDPTVIAGAFADDTAAWDDYQPNTSGPAIAFTSPDGSRIKAYRLTGTGLEVAYQARGPVTTHIPLALDPQAFYFDPTQYQAALYPATWTWELAAGLRVEVRTDASLSALGFTASLPFLPFSEDPDQNYPPGHYFPFPLSVVEVRGEGPFHVWISVR